MCACEGERRTRSWLRPPDLWVSWLRARWPRPLGCATHRELGWAHRVHRCSHGAQHVLRPPGPGFSRATVPVLPQVLPVAPMPAGDGPDPTSAGTPLPACLCSLSLQNALLLGAAWSRAGQRWCSDHRTGARPGPMWPCTPSWWVCTPPGWASHQVSAVPSSPGPGFAGVCPRKGARPAVCNGHAVWLRLRTACSLHLVADLRLMFSHVAGGAGSAAPWL